jgi:peptide/nickel transport system permease protein
VSGSSRPVRASFARSFMRSRNATIGAVMVGLFLVCAALAPLLTPFDPYVIDLHTKELAPSVAHPMGTDNLGRDVFARVMYGTRISLRVGVIAMTISLLIGTFLGAIAGFFGGKLDSFIMRFTDVFLALPAAILALAVMAIFENPSVNKIFFVLGLIGWTTIARLVRSRVLEIRNEEYVIAAAALGFGRMRTLLRHVLPNAAAPIIVAATIGIAGNILTEAWLSFLGLGAPPHIPSWGRMITEGQSYLVTASKPWIYVFPGMALFFTVIGFNLLGDGLRDVLDPTLKD